MDVVTLVLGAALSIVGAVALVGASRHGRAGRRADERRLFLLAVAALALGSLCFLATVLLGA